MSEATNELRVRGFIHTIYPTKTFESGFSKRDFDLETREKGRDGKEYKNVNTFTGMKSFAQILDGIGIGSEVVVHFQLNGRIWETPEKTFKVINSLRAWKIEVINNTNQERPEVKGATQPPQEYQQPDDESQDLPF